MAGTGSLSYISSRPRNAKKYEKKDMDGGADAADKRAKGRDTAKPESSGSRAAPKRAKAEEETPGTVPPKPKGSKRPRKAK